MQRRRVHPAEEIGIEDDLRRIAVAELDGEVADVMTRHRVTREQVARRLRCRRAAPHVGQRLARAGRERDAVCARARAAVIRSGSPGSWIGPSPPARGGDARSHAARLRDLRGERLARRELVGHEHDRQHVVDHRARVERLVLHLCRRTTRRPGSRTSPQARSPCAARTAAARPSAPRTSRAGRASDALARRAAGPPPSALPASCATRTLPMRDHAGRVVEDERMRRVRHADAERVGRQARVGAAPRRHERRRQHVDEVDRREARARRTARPSARCARDDARCARPAMHTPCCCARSIAMSIACAPITWPKPRCPSMPTSAPWSATTAHALPGPTRGRARMLSRYSGSEPDAVRIVAEQVRLDQALETTGARLVARRTPGASTKASVAPRRSADPRGCVVSLFASVMSPCAATCASNGSVARPRDAAARRARPARGRAPCRLRRPAPLRAPAGSTAAPRRECAAGADVDDVREIALAALVGRAVALDQAAAQRELVAHAPSRSRRRVTASSQRSIIACSCP